MITATGAQPTGRVGPAWADTEAKAEVVRNPLRVQDHVVRTVGLYVPGVTAVTTHARYYALHPWLAAHAAKNSMSRGEFSELVRRCEVVMAWASHNHREHLTELPVAHGRDAILRHVNGDNLNVTEAARRGEYSAGAAGFLGTAYRNPETVLGVFAPTWAPGDRFTRTASAGVHANLAGIIELAQSPVVTAEEAREGADRGWCICHARSGGEGSWLRELFAGTLGGAPKQRATDLTRRDTIRLLARAIEQLGRGAVATADDVTDEPRAEDPETILRDALVFSGPLAEASVADGLVEYAEKWRGLLLRHYCVTAWRRLWGDIVAAVGGESRTAWEIGAILGQDVDDVSLGQFARGFRTIEDGRLLPAEEAAWNEHPGPRGSLAVLCISAARTTQVSPIAAEVLGFDDLSELGPGWIARQIEAEGKRPLREWVSTLCEQLLTRAQRIGLDKFRVDPIDGRAVVPAQVAERDGFWHKVNEVGSAPLGLRIASLTTVLAGAGILDHHDGTWRVTEAGRRLSLV